MPRNTTVREFMTTRVLTLSPDDPVERGAKLLGEHRIGAAPVVDDDGRVVGLFRDEDLLLTEANLHVPTIISFLDMEVVLPRERRRFEDEMRRAVGSTVGEVMTKDFVTVAPSALLEDLATLMHDSDVSHVPVVEDGKLVGIVARGDLVRCIAKDL